MLLSPLQEHLKKKLLSIRLPQAHIQIHLQRLNMHQRPHYREIRLGIYLPAPLLTKSKKPSLVNSSLLPLPMMFPLSFLPYPLTPAASAVLAITAAGSSGALASSIREAVKMALKSLITAPSAYILLLFSYDRMKITYHPSEQSFSAPSQTPNPQQPPLFSTIMTPTFHYIPDSRSILFLLFLPLNSPRSLSFKLFSRGSRW